MLNWLSAFKNLNIIGLALRGLSMLGKLALVILVTKNGTLEDLGVYGLFLTSIALLNYVQGLEFNRFTAREISCQSREKTTQMIVNQMFVHFITYAVALPLSLLIFFGGFLSWEFVLYFLWVAIFTHLSQEVSRLLIIFAQTTQAYMVSFLTHGLWACIAVFIYFLSPKSISLDVIFLLWSGSSVLGLMFGVFYLIKTGRFGSVDIEIDMKWVKQGLAVSYNFFIGVIAFKVIELSDRFFIKYFHGESLVGVYTFYGSVANIVQEFVYTGAVVILIPTLLVSYKNKDYQQYNAQLRTLKSSVWRYSCLIALIVLLFMFLLLPYLDRELLSANYASFMLLVMSCFLLNLSLIPHYKLYMAQQDQALMWSALFGVSMNLVLNYLLIPTLGALGAAIATVLSFSLVLICKILFVRKFNRLGLL